MKTYQTINRRHTKVALATGLASIIAISAIAGAGASGVAPGPNGALAVMKPGPGHRGEDAIRRLGPQLDATARKVGWTGTQLRDELRTDRSLNVSAKSNLYYSEPAPAAGPTSAGAAGQGGLWSTTPPLPIETTFKLHSDRNANRKIYLDFNGHTTRDSEWNDEYNKSTIVSAPWDLDGKPATYNAQEHAFIQNVFLSVKADFASFGVDVTTENPGTDKYGIDWLTPICYPDPLSCVDPNYGMRVVISPTNFTGKTIGGEAFVNSLTWLVHPPAFVFASRNHGAKFVAETASHEVGHTAGLRHDGVKATASAQKEDYCRGHGDWAPIMGTGMDRAVSQWSKGEYGGASNSQNDLSILGAGNHFPTRGDDYVNTPDTKPTAFVTVVFPGIDNPRFGKITKTGDIDVHKFIVPSPGRYSFTAIPEDYALTGSNLNVAMKITDGSGNTVANVAPRAALDATTTANLAGGIYFVHISGGGDGTSGVTGYTNYGSLGNYKLMIK